VLELLLVVFLGCLEWIPACVQREFVWILPCIYTVLVSNKCFKSYKLCLEFI
jgi:hypothetical protein